MQMRRKQGFNELEFFSDVKKRPGMYFGTPSLISLRDYLGGMEHAFSYFYDYEEIPLTYFRSFVTWYYSEVLDDQNGYACWWNHILYTSGHNDCYAFELFFAVFERYLHDVHHTGLPAAE